MRRYRISAARLRAVTALPPSGPPATESSRALSIRCPADYHRGGAWLEAFESALLDDARTRGYERGAGLQANLPTRHARYDVFSR